MCPPHDEDGRSPSGLWARVRPLRAAMITLLCVGQMSCKTAPAPQSTEHAPVTISVTPDPSALGLGSGDVVRVDILGHPELSTPAEGLRLDTSGSIYLPVVGRVSLNGLSVDAANGALREAYGAFMKAPDVSFALIRRESKRFFVLGQIQTPGPHSIEHPLTALEAVSHGGFFLNAADRSNVFLVRPHGSELEVHCFNAETPDPDGLVQVLPGDIVFVRRKGSQRFQEEFLPLLQPWQIAVPSAVAAGVL